MIYLIIAMNTIDMKVGIIKIIVVILVKLVPVIIEIITMMMIIA